MTFNLPFPPTLNHMHLSKGRMRFLSGEYKAFIALVANIVQREKIPAMGSQRLSVAIWLHWPNKRRGDIDNRCKPILDALQRVGVYDDDSQIDELHVYRADIVKLGYCKVNIAPIEG